MTDNRAQQEEINLLRLLENRIGEIIAVETEIKKKNPRLFHQRLPRFMRRRAASHNPHRIPKKLRPTKFNVRERKRLYKYRLNIRYRKHKRILKTKQLHKYKDPNKCLLHKWFAKRFKLSALDELKPIQQFIPIHNSTKNYRNLYRQIRYGCAYLSMAHLIGCRIELAHSRASLNHLNKLAVSTSGFTFAARALESGRYEVTIFLFKRKEEDKSRKRTYLCPVQVLNYTTHFELWFPREKVSDVCHQLELAEIPHKLIMPRDSTRIRLVGPEARAQINRLVEGKSSDKETAKLAEAIEDVEKRLLPSQAFGTTLGRVVQISHETTVIFYQTKPLSVDLIFRKKPGRLLWYKLIKNRAHLVGGLRDVEQLLTADCFKLCPDNHSAT